MSRILYIGNKLSSKKRTVTTIETLGVALENEGFKILYASHFNNKVVRIIHMLWAVFKERDSVNYVLIDTYSTLNFYYAYAVSQLCRRYNLKYIPILHGGNLPNRLEKNPKLSKAIFKYAHVNIAPSQYTKDNFKKHNIANVICIPNTIEIEDYSCTFKDINAIKLLWVRSFSSIYNPKLAIDVLLKLKLLYPKTSLTMVGPDKDGSLKDMKRYAASKEVEVNFTGKLSKKEWLAIGERHNVFINTTNFDNMPVSVIEAMALGLPVVSTNVGGMPFLIDSGLDGLLVPPNNSEAFVKAIVRLKTDEVLLATLTKNARTKAESYGWNVVKYNWLKVLKVLK